MIRSLSTLLILLCLGGLVPDSAFCSSAPKVLLLHSYHAGYKWTDNITAAVENTLQQDGAFRIDLRIEYLDTKRYNSKRHYSTLHSYLLAKYKGFSFDAIICSDNNALNFLVDNRDSLFPDVPVVFCGINYFERAMLKGEKNITGVNESIRNDITIELMRKVHPGVKKVVVVTDITPTGAILQKDIQMQAENHPDIDWVFPLGKSREELLSLLQALGDGDLVYLNVYLKDDKGHIEFDESTELISSHSPVPVYNSSGFTLGYGVIGGYMTSGTFQGAEAASIVLRVLAGTPADDIPVVMESPNRYFADSAVLEAFGIPAGSFPPETVFINNPPNFYRDHKTAILITLFLLAGLTVLSVALTVNTIRKKRVENELLTLTTELEVRVHRRTEELQQALESIHENEEKMNHLLSNLSGMVYRCRNDRQWTMLYASEAALKLTGYQPADLLLNSTIAYIDIIHENDREMVAKMVATAINNRRPFTVEYRIVTKPGEIKWVWEQGLAVYDSSGSVSYLDGIVTDITERKLIELEQKKLAIAVYQTDDLIIITSSQGNIEYVNPAFERVSGFSSAEVIGKNPRILKSGKQGQEVYREMWSTIGSGKVYRGPLINRRKDGQEYIAEVTISPIWNQYKEITHYVSVQRDITQEKAMERELRHAQKLEALGTLAGGIAHEINTPAQFVTSNLSFVHESFGDIRSYISESLELLTSTDDTKGVSVSRVRSIYEEHDIEYLVEEFPLALKQSIDGIKQITNIVLSMKQFAHPGEDSQVAADINEAIRNSVTVCRNEWKYIADINFELDEELPHIECHISDISQVILNIIVNAAHALESAGYGTTEKGRITIRSRQKKGGILIAIEDNGGGIPESIKARIFDPFFTTKEVGKGTGQGLAIAHSIITEKHGGKLSFTSTDQGTVFYIQLPVT